MQQDRDHICEVSPWHIHKHAVILSDFDECMFLSKLKFDKLQVWARVVNLPFNLRDEACSKLIAKQIDKNATSVHFDHEGGYLHARVTLDVAKQLRRWILIESARRELQTLLTFNMETFPTFAFLVVVGHSDLYCPTPANRDEHGDLPFGKGLRPPEEKKRAPSAESSAKSQQSKPARTKRRTPA